MRQYLSELVLNSKSHQPKGTKNMQAKNSQRIFLLSVLILSSITTVSLHNSFAQNYTQMSLPEGAIARLGKGELRDFLYSPDGKVLAVAYTNGI